MLNRLLRIAGLGVESIPTPMEAPRANAVGERVVRSLRGECLDHILPLSEQRAVVSRPVLNGFHHVYERAA